MTSLAFMYSSAKKEVKHPYHTTIKFSVIFYLSLDHYGCHKTSSNRPFVRLSTYYQDYRLFMTFTSLLTLTTKTRIHFVFSQ